MERMGETVEAEYLAEERILKLAHPLPGIGDHERVRVVVESCARIETDGWPALDDDAGREVASAIRQAFGRDEIAI